MADENKANQEAPTQPLPQQFEIAVLPLQNTTLFPDTVVPLAVGRERSMRAVESSLATEEKLLACVTTKTENVTGDDAKFGVGKIVEVTFVDIVRLPPVVQVAGSPSGPWRTR